MMRILFAISMLSFFTLLAAVLALIKKAYASQHLLQSESSRLRASGLHARTQDRDQVEPGSRPLLHQSFDRIGPEKAPDWRFMVQGGNGSHLETMSTRKGPQPTHFATPERSDWTYFNKDLGDLSDPYEPQRLTGTSPRRPIS